MRMLPESKLNYSNFIIQRKNYCIVCKKHIFLFETVNNDCLKYKLSHPTPKLEKLTNSPYYRTTIT